MGLPVSFLQQRYDTYWDMKFGSSKMYLFRGQMNFLVILVVVLLMPMMLLQRGAMLALMAALGVSSWMLHGTACMLASMVSTSAISALHRAAKESEIPNFKGSYLGRFPLVSADFWTSDHLSERSRSVDAFSGTRARGTLTLKRR
jgi:hypothetical protein